MSSQEGSNLTCEVCFEPYLASTQPDRRPRIICSNGHSFCSQCCSSLTTCPMCRAPCLPTPIVNIALLKIIDSRSVALSSIPEIPSKEVAFIQSDPIAMGSYSEVFLCRWSQQRVAVKKLRITQKSEQMKSLKLETSLAISLFHPNIVRIFGCLKMDNGFLGIVMEWADQGSLKDQISSLSFSQKVGVALCICDGVSYLHSKKIAHRDLKPDNVLLFGSEPVAKISDFGTSKVIQTMISNTSMAGTPKYSAPELLDVGLKCGRSADVYSVAIILYELFSELDPFPDCQTIMQVVKALLMNKRPNFPKDFPNNLKGVIQKGWQTEPESRPEVSVFHAELLKLEVTNEVNESTMIVFNTSISANDQIHNIGSLTMPVPLISMQWSSECEVDNSKNLRLNMISNLRERSNFKSKITASVFKAMEVVPRHLFNEKSRTQGSSNLEKIEHVYTYNKAMGATMWSNESSPEIVGVQLSLVKIDTGSSVLLIGGKGGYINSIIAQVAGISGNLVTVSSNQNILDVCKERTVKNSPLSRIMGWKCIVNVADPATVLQTLNDQKFHAIIYCGAVQSLPLELAPLLHFGGSLIAPIQIEENQQQFQMIIQETANKREIRKITDFGVIFEKVQ